MSNEKINLAPCPFCGAIPFTTFHRGMYYGGCNNEDCPMSRVVTGEYSTRAEVIIALNSRPASDLQQRLDKAEKALEKAYKDLDDSGAWDMYKDVCDVMGDINKALAAITPAQAKDKEIEE